MNLEKLNLVELNAQEKQEVDGGLHHIGPHIPVSRTFAFLHGVVDFCAGFYAGISGGAK